MNWSKHDTGLPAWAKYGENTAFIRALKAEVDALAAEYMADLESVYGISPFVFRPTVYVPQYRSILGSVRQTLATSYPATPNTAPIPRERALVVQP